MGARFTLIYKIGLRVDAHSLYWGAFWQAEPVDRYTAVNAIRKLVVQHDILLARGLLVVCTESRLIWELNNFERKLTQFCVCRLFFHTLESA